MPPLNPKKISPATLITFDCTFFIEIPYEMPVNDIVSPAQAKIFINGVIKGQNQAIGMILHIII